MLSPTMPAGGALGYDKTVGLEPDATGGPGPLRSSPGSLDPAIVSARTALAPSSRTGQSFTAPAGGTRITVLPRIEGDGAALQLVNDALSRYEPVKLLGAGGMGEVLLVEDKDIARKVAVKRLLPELTDPAILARFIDEIRTVGRLEHPNIVPIHDVGVDELGRYFFVMKYVEGETLESVIQKLASGDPAYRRRYSFEQRIELFIGVLHALDFAHSNGFVHRDVKPANIMIGRYGEVVLMDWGIAKPLSATRDGAAGTTATVAAADDGGERARMYSTRIGSLIGTPAYMAPEQARGENGLVDARSDLYSATVLFHELVCGRHYLDEKTTLDGLLTGVKSEEQTFMKLVLCHGPHQGAPPGELIHFVLKGLSKDPAARFQSAREMIAVLQDILDGRVRVQCHITLTKRTTRELGRLVDRQPHVAFVGLLGVLAMLVFGVVQLVRMLTA